MNILGIHGGVTLSQHDAAAAIISDGNLITVCEEERFARFKSARGMIPVRSIAAALKESNMTIKDIDILVHPGETYEDMPERIRRYMKHYFGHCPKVELINHQTAHMASAYFCSGFNESMVISYDGYGDRLSAAIGTGKNGVLNILETRPWNNSLGDYYETMTSFLGFERGEGEYKVMGLSPYGNPEKYDLSPFLSVSETGYYCDVSFIRSNPPARSVYEPSYSEKLVELLGEPRKPGSEITRRHMDIAAAVQFALERAAVSLIQYLHSRTGLRNLALAGGVALNCAANRIITELPFIDRLFVQPAASDRGLALGCALYMANQEGCPAQPLKHAFYGPTYSLDDLRETLRLTGATFCECNNPAEKAARLLCEGKIVGWYQGRSEFGPRALGNRSILADPSSLEMKDLVNAKIKFRESFRPFAPAVLEEHAAELFEIPYASPFMTITFKTRAEWRNKLQAVNHVNNTARVQTVSKDTNPLFHDLITHFHAAAGIPCVLNTSYNVRGQPIVETVKDALTTFAASGMDAVFIGPFLLEKQPCCS